MKLPDTFRSAHPGPQFGIPGSRRLTGVEGRPIIGTIVKPALGLRPQETAALVGELIASGVDFIKDDEKLTSPAYSPLKDRVEAIMAAPALSHPLRRAASLGAGAIAAALVGAWAVAQVPATFGVLGVLLAVPAVGLCVGAFSGVIIAKTRMQPFIVTLAMMVGILGVARLVAGQDTAVHPVYTGENATADFEDLRALIYRILPVPGLFFLAAVAIFHIVLKRSTFGRYVYAIGGNEQAARLSGINVDRVKIAVYALSGMRSSRTSKLRGVGL